MPVLEHLEPKKVFHYFEELSAIPRGSRHTQSAGDWCAAFARQRHLEHHRDAAGNVIIIAPAAPGYESAPPLILQGHLDMVCEKDPDCPVDMERQGPELLVDGDYVRAKGTTLGGDDGIAVAMALAVLDTPSLPRPRLEVVLTVDEEIGMLGAAALDPSPLRGRQLLNLDSEAEGVFTVSCAGGCTAVCSFPAARRRIPGTAFRVRVSGLTGGHSGTEIHHGRANANVVLGQVLRGISRNTDLHLIRAAGGLKDNAIPVAAEAEFLAGNPSVVRGCVPELLTSLRRSFRGTDPNLALTLEDTDAAPAMDRLSTERIIRFLTEAPAGIQSMSRNIPGLVQTSLNLGIFYTDESAAVVSLHIRSSSTAEKADLVRRLESLAVTTLGGTVRIEGDYPAWEYRPESPLRRRCAAVFREQYGHAPKIEAVHAGLECGVLCGKIPGLDCVSLGPDLPDIHTPRERMSIPSVRRVWNFLLEVLKRSR